ncbi:MAG TPA: glycoside hydrolase family 2 TIM barrel-domain containing protein [Chloroflexota bacterium]|nr:glycoside hydrolase family 2 TIM barrel-domain containing protein [Chloroflexota bacterium]
MIKKILNFERRAGLGAGWQGGRPLGDSGAWRLGTAPLVSLLPVLAAVTVVYLLVRPLLAVFQAGAMLGAAELLHRLVASGLADRLAVLGPGDPVYKSVALWTLAGIDPVGLALGEPLGGWLHAQAASLFAAPAALPAGAWVGGVVAEGATLLAELVVQLAGYVALAAVGVAGLWLGRRKRCGGGRCLWLELLAVLLLLQGVLGLARLLLALSPHDLETLGLVHILSKTWRWTPTDYPALLSIAPALLLRGGALGGTLLLALALAARAVAGAARTSGAGAASRHWGSTVLVAGWALLLVSVPAGWLMDADLLVQAPASGVRSTASEPETSPALPAGPSVVTIEGEPFQFTYKVNGVRQVIRGIGYNVAYATHDRAWRAARYARDFALIRAAGFNTLIGWDEREFDELTLDQAHAHGLGVIWPYRFPPDGDYTDPAFRAQQRERVLRFVAQYARHPAVRMWGLGNEVLHDMPEERWPTQAEAFADFYAELVVAVHALDPSHPVLYRDSEDVWFEPVRAALVARGLEQPWMVYGANIFTFRLRELIEGWPSRGLRVPLLISEYGPTGFAPEDRPAALVAMWDIIRQYRAYVLGGAIYAWTTEGIEAIDRVYGLVDDAGQPVDGALAAIAARYTAARQACATKPCQPAAPAVSHPSLAPSATPE